MTMINKAVFNPPRYYRDHRPDNGSEHKGKFRNEIPHRFGYHAFTLSAGSYANSLCQEKEQDIQRKLATLKSTTISAVLRV